MNNRESINRYNKLLIQYLNDLVSDVSNNTELKQRTFQDVSTRLKEYLNSLEMNIDQNTIILILNQAFVAYSDILKKYFDSSNVHRIDISLATSPTLPREMSTITNNLKVAVENINKIEQYNNLIKKIKDSIIYQIRQVNPNYNYYVEQIDQALNNIVIESINTFTISKIESFLKTTLPDLSAFEDEVNRIIEEKMAIQNNVNVNEERDQFINETMDIEIHEGFENGVVTLLVIDQMGNQKMYYDQEAMEKLTNYNRLFESSRPGKKADTSRWPKANKKNNKKQIPKLDLTNNFLGSARLDNGSSNRNNKTNANSGSNDNNAFKNFLNKYDNSNINNDKLGLPIDDINKVVAESSDFNNLTSPVNNKNILDVSNGIFAQSNNTNNVEDEGMKKLRSMMGMEENSSPNSSASDSLLDSSIMNTNNFNNNNNNDNKTTFLDIPLDNQTSQPYPSNNTPIETLPNNHFINFQEEVQPEQNQAVDQGIGIKVNLPNEENFAFSATDSLDNSSQVKMFMDKMNPSSNQNENSSQPTPSFSGGNSFIPNYVNPNEDRDEFIKMATGLIIEEDKDPDGDVFLRVIEPTGRETIHTGRDAVEMIKNYNRVYLEANPNKTVDTSLIDNYDEH